MFVSINTNINSTHYTFDFTDFVDITIGKYCAGVVAFVSVSVKNIDINRENIGYATSTANSKGFAIYKSRKVG